ncbi:MAG: DJ-1 family glyoxalase III [Acutalibacteraceae bacterium]|nr:DJ-1 family glyoxalase III [Acutalibacteraceae bacterium]
MVYLFLADGFEECEALCPLDILRRGGIEIKTVGVGKEYITGTHGITVKADILESQIVLDENLEGVILPGGMPGTNNLEQSETVKQAVTFANEKERLVCAICAAPKILGGMGLLEDKNAVCFPGFENDLMGAILASDSVVQNGNIITAKGVGVAFEFGFKILENLTDKNTVADLRKKMQFS